MSKMKNSWKLLRSCPKTENSITYGLLTKCEVKMAECWPCSFFLRVYGPKRRRAP